MDKVLFIKSESSMKNSKLNYTKKFSALVLVFAMFLQLVGCSDKSWCIKNSNETLPVGVYIYNVYIAYQEAYYKVNTNVGNNLVGSSTSSADFLSQTIEEKPAVEWIQDTAMKNTKMIISIDEKMKQLGLEFTPEDEAKARQNGDATWQKMGATLETFGVSRNSFDIATGIMSAKYDKLFDAIYGANGTEAVAADQINTYFLENFVDYSYIKKEVMTGSSYQIVGSEASEIEDTTTQAELSETETTQTETTQIETTQTETTTTAESAQTEETQVDSTSSLPDVGNVTSDSSSTTTPATPQEEEEKAKQQFTEYENMIAQGSTMEDVDAKYQQDEELTESQLQSATEDINKSELPQEVKDMYATMANNTAKMVKTDGAYYLIYKKDINNKVADLQNEDFKKQVLQSMKDEEYSNNLEADIDGLGIEVNSAAINEYTPYMFEKNKKK